MIQDNQKIMPNGDSLVKLIDGVILKKAITQTDDRGTLCEVCSEKWDIMNFPATHVYTFTIRPNKVKGWVIHHLQTDRLFIIKGSIKFVLFDDRPESATNGMVNEIFFDDYNRATLLIPPYVWHLAQNIGVEDAYLVNTPDRPYDYVNPDKYRLPINNNLIPYKI